MGYVVPMPLQVPLDGRMRRWAYSTNFSVAAMRPRRLKKRRAGLYYPTLEKALTRARSPSIRSSGRYNLPRSVQNLAPMYTRSCVGVRSDFFRFTMNPARTSTWRVVWKDCATLQGDYPRMRMLSRYEYNCTPLSLSQATRGARVLMKNRRAEVSPKDRALNW